MEKFNEIIKKALHHEIKEAKQFVLSGERFTGEVSNIYEFSMTTEKEISPSSIEFISFEINGTWSAMLRIGRGDSEDLKGYVEKPFIVENSKYTVTMVNQEVQDIQIDEVISVMAHN